MNQTQWQRHTKRAVALAVAAGLALPPAALGQSAASGQNLKLLVLAGQNGINDLEKQIMSPLAVQVLDQNDQPVEGATVIFRFPLNGASATFADSQTAQTVRTSATGQARATGWLANKQAGTYAVQVTATRGPDQGTATVTMANVERVIPEKERPKKRWWTSKWAKIAYVAGAGAIAGGIVLSARGPGATVITGGPGSPSIGGPQ